MTFQGIIVGAAVFLIIGICHPIVIMMEYYWGKQSWWLLALAGVVFAGISLFVANPVWSTILGAAAFSCFWGNPRNNSAGETRSQALVSRESQTSRLLQPEAKGTEPHLTAVTISQCLFSPGRITML